MLAEGQRLNSAILFANEILGLPLNEQLKPSHFSSDSFRIRLFMDTVESILLSLNPKDKLVTCKRFGLGQTPMTIGAIAQELDITPSKVKFSLRRITHRSNTSLKASQDHLGEFLADQSNEDLAAQLDTLEPIYPYRKKS